MDQTTYSSELASFVVNIDVFQYIFLCKTSVLILHFYLFYVPVGIFILMITTVMNVTDYYRETIRISTHYLPPYLQSHKDMRGKILQSYH